VDVAARAATIHAVLMVFTGNTESTMVPSLLAPLVPPLHGSRSRARTGGLDPTSSTAIALCGTYQVQLDGKRVEHRLPGRGGRLAFAYLVIGRAQPTPRDALAAAIWEDNAPQNPDSALRTLLTRMRAVVGQEMLSGRGEISLALPDDASVDVEIAAAHLAEAERARTERQWERTFDHASLAMPILSADLLPNLHADWIEVARRAHSERYVRALTCVATAGLELGDAEHLAVAESASRTMIELEPLRETGNGLFIRALAAQGDRAHALLAYDELRAQLNGELGVAPGQELRQLHHQLLQDESVTPAATPEAAQLARATAQQLRLPARAVAQAARPIFGRGAELAWLERELTLVCPEGRTLALLAGEPGIGKTRLAAEFARVAHKRGANILWGSCHDGGFVPYEPFADIVRQYLVQFDDDERAELLERTGADVLELVPSLTRRAARAPERLDANTQRYRLFDAVSSLLIDAARQRPLVVVLEDLHWADPSTLNLLLHLHRVDECAPMAMLATYRDAEAVAGQHLARTLAELGRVTRVVTTRVRGLDEQHTAQLVGALSGTAVLPDMSRRIHARSDGNPFFVGEIVRWSEEARDADTVSHDLNDLLMRRIGHLSADAVELLHIAAVIGRDFDRAALEEVCPYDGERMLDLVEEAMRARVIEEAPGDVLRYSFCHALIREALYGELSRTRRARVHRAVADAFTARSAEIGPGGSAELAHHLHAAIEDSDGAARAMQASILAGDHARSKRAYEDAVRHYDRALAVVEQARAGDYERCSILLARGAAQRRTGDAPAARETFERAGELARVLGDGRRLASAALGFGGRDHVPLTNEQANERLIELILEALLQLPREATGLRARLLGRLSIELLSSIPPDRRAALSSEALALARESGDEAVIGYVLATRRVTTWSPANVQTRLALSSETVAIADRIDDSELGLQGHQWLAADLLEMGDATRSRNEMRRHAQLAQNLRQPFHRWVAGGLRVTYAHMAGAFKRAERLAEHAYSDGVIAHEDDAFQSLSAQLFWIRRDQGRLDELGDLVERSLQRFEATATFWQALATLHAAETGATKVAEQRLAGLAAEDALTAIAIDPDWCPTMACLAQASGRVGDPASAARLYRALSPFGASNVVARGGICLGAVSGYLGILARTCGWWRAAEEHCEHALAFNAALGAPAVLARTQHEYALMLAQRGEAKDTQRSLALAESARVTAVELGMSELESAVLPLTRLGQELGMTGS
jgi:DNA-binding SARP family transcriptional activator/tetratricopeptide (TPR) repeat protein